MSNHQGSPMFQSMMKFCDGIEQASTAFNQECRQFTDEEKMQLTVAELDTFNQRLLTLTQGFAEGL